MSQCNMPDLFQLAGSEGNDFSAKSAYSFSLSPKGATSALLHHR